MKKERPLLVSAREFLNGPQLVTRSMDRMEPLDVTEAQGATRFGAMLDENRIGSKRIATAVNKTEE